MEEGIDNQGVTKSEDLSDVGDHGDDGGGLLVELDGIDALEQLLQVRLNHQRVLRLYNR